jgi:putative chitobiose transport system substrate-binding protein
MRLKRLAMAALFALVQRSALAGEHIEFWTFSLKPKFTAHFEALVRDYEAGNPGVTVEWVDLPWDAIQTKLITRIVAGTPPALVNLNVPWADELARDGLLTPVDALLGKAKGDYLASAIDDLTFKGKVYGFPWYSNVAVIAYNTELFKQAGIAAPPRSLDEELAMARSIAAKTGKAGICPSLAKIDGLFLQQGLPVIVNRRAAFNTARHVALIDQLAATYKAGGLLKDSLFAEDNFAGAVAAYTGGRLAMLLAPPTALGRVRADAPAIYAVTDIAPAPLGPTGIADGGWLIHFAVPKGVERKLLPAVGKFALYLTDATRQHAFASAAHVFPSSRAGMRLPPLASPAQPLDAKAKAAGTWSMPHARTLYVTGVEDYDELRRTLVKAVEAAVTGKDTARHALAQAAAIWDKKLAAAR